MTFLLNLELNPETLIADPGILIALRVTVFM
jgi:hypothetical protein